VLGFPKAEAALDLEKLKNNIVSKNDLKLFFKNWWSLSHLVFFERLSHLVEGEFLSYNMLMAHSFLQNMI
jgi:hypothetical protein